MEISFIFFSHSRQNVKNSVIYGIFWNLDNSKICFVSLILKKNWIINHYPLPPPHTPPKDPFDFGSGTKVAKNPIRPKLLKIRPTFVSKYDLNMTKIGTYLTENTTHLSKYDHICPNWFFHFWYPFKIDEKFRKSKKKLRRSEKTTLRQKYIWRKWSGQNINFFLGV